MYMKTLLGLFSVLHILNNVDALPVTGQAGNAALSADNIDQTMKDAVQTLLAGLILKGNDLRAELQEEARALLDDPYPFDSSELIEVAQLANQELAEAREPKPLDEKEEALPIEEPVVPVEALAREAPEGLDSRDAAGKSLRSLADDTLDELKRIYTRSETVEPHHRFSDFFHMPSLSSILGDYPTYPMDTPLVQPLPAVTTPVVDPIPEVTAPVVPVVAPVVSETPVVDVTPPIVAPAPAPPVDPLPEVPPTVARSVDDEEPTSQNADEN